MSADLRRTEPGRTTIWLAAAVSWLGLLVHNVADLPDQHIYSPETSFISILLLIALALFAVRPRPGLVLLLVWSGLHILGAIFSVIPFDWLPFVPEQSHRHYAFHVLYLLTQFPLARLAFEHLRRDRTVRGDVTPATTADPAQRSGQMFAWFLSR